MIQFVIFVILFIVVVVVFVLLLFWLGLCLNKKKIDCKEVNLVIFCDQLVDFDWEKFEGMLVDVDFNQFRSELQCCLLEEVEVENEVVMIVDFQSLSCKMVIVVLLLFFIFGLLVYGFFGNLKVFDLM